MRLPDGPTISCFVITVHLNQVQTISARRRSPAVKKMKILVFSFSFIGDAVLSTAVIQPLRAHFPDAQITFLVGPRAFDLLAAEPNIDTVIVYDNRGEHRGWQGRLRLIKTLRYAKFDLVVNLRDSLMARCIGAEHWGMVRGDGNRHAVTRYLEVLQRHNVDTTDAHPHLQLN